MRIRVGTYTRTLRISSGIGIPIPAKYLAMPDKLQINTRGCLANNFISSTGYGVPTIDSLYWTDGGVNTSKTRRVFFSLFKVGRDLPIRGEFSIKSRPMQAYIADKYRRPTRKFKILAGRYPEILF